MAAIFFIAAFCLLISGCVNSDNVVYSRFKALSDQEWHKGQYLEFEIDSLVEKDADYDVLLVIRHNDTYKYKTLCVVVEEYMRGEIELADSIDINLVNTDGKWRGKGQYGLYEIVDTLRRDEQLSESYLVSLCHGMKREIVEGITDVGIVVKR